MKKSIIFTFSLILFPSMALLFVYFSDNYITKKIKSYIPPIVKQSVKDIVFYFPEMKKLINLQSSRIDDLLQVTYKLKQENNIYKINMIKNQKLEILGSNRILDNYALSTFDIPFSNYNFSKKASFYLSLTDEFIYLISGTGKILKLRKENLVKQKLKPVLVSSNIKDIIKDQRHFDINRHSPISGQVSIKDSMIINNKLFLSYNRAVRNDCYNTSIIVADINDTKLFFENFFTFDKCIQREKGGGIANYHARQSGGRMAIIDESKMLFTIGDYRVRTLAQDDKSMFGKIIQIDLKTKKYDVYSKGHRNPQGLTYLKARDKIISTEHGPYGGDEINVIKKNGNYGWPISSYGRHYDKKFKKEAPLHKSHKDYGFEEPIFNFSKIESVGVSQIVHLGQNKEGLDILLVGSMRAKKLFFYNVDKTFLKADLFKTIYIGERIRDIVYDKETENILLSLENTPKLSILSLNPPDYF